ncbi:hypothetical protein QCA50_000676 [Cerrena zonata]|uniref:Uncharacterized protein n=1 Tax=Cerrena zonata TaxID=2478898 RepID=A0AAW0GXP6_9APHY
MNIPNEAISIREAYRRNMDESKDIATSYKYVMEMDQLAGQAAIVDDASLIPTNTVPSVEDAPRGRSPQKSAVKKLSIPEASGSGSNLQPINADTKDGDKQEEKPVEAKDKKGVASTVGTPDKGKRKVTFVVHPDVAIIDDEPTRERGTKRGASGGEEAAVFDFENESGEREGEEIIDPLAHRNNASEPTTPVEPIHAPRRPQRVRKTDMSGLPSSLSTLRPSSLPMPSAMRPLIPHQKVDLNPTTDAQRDEKNNQSLEDSPLTSPAEDPEEELDSREAEILKLVAAHTPSHRSAWKKNSKAWQLFVSRQGKKNRKAVDRIPEEDEDSTSSRAGYYDESDGTTESDERQPDPFVPLATSAPIPIAPISQGRNFGAPSYQPKTSLSDRPGVLVPTFRKSSAALRKASYAERDRMRSIDPGIVDFVDEDDGEDEDDEDDDAVLGDDVNVQQVGGRARRRALKILQARDSVPAAGMWRSLA